ncbi:MAG: hypothetical protein V4773_06780 [Verrucomicrobiota bacterium]
MRPLVHRPPRWLGWLAGLVGFAIFSVVYSSRVHPPVAPSITLEVRFPVGVPGEREPLLCTGMWSEGDLLVVRYLDEKTAVLSYDHWGAGGPDSPPFELLPDTPRTLEIAMPSFTTFEKPPAGTRAPLRVTLDGRELFALDVLFHGRQPKQIYFGANSIGATASQYFRGQLRRPGGHAIRGGPESHFTAAELGRFWVRTSPLQVLRAAVYGAAVGGLVWWLTAWFLNRPPRAQPYFPPPVPDIPVDPLQLRRSRRWFFGSLAVCTFLYTWLVTLGSFQFNYAEIFGNFYDYQAASFLQGRLDVPEDAIGGEAFEAKGKLYGYFGPTPALLRLPFVAAGVAFGKLSRALMVLYFIAALVAAYRLLGEASRPRVPSPFAVVLLVASAGLGSTIFFVGCRSYVFHEAILAGITFALWSCWCSLRHLRTPARRWWVWALIFGVLSLHSRPPTGLFALTLLGVVVVFLAWHERPRRLLRHAGVGVLCFVGLLTLNGMAYLKFGLFDPAPLRISRPYQDLRRISYIEGKSFHLVNIDYNIDTYVVRANVRLEPNFPWIFLGTRRPHRGFPESKIDLPDHTLAMPYAMPSLFALATLGCLAAIIFLPGTRAGVLVLWVAVMPMSLALFAAIATAQRYTGDWVPFLVAAAAFGLAAVESAPPRWRFALRVALVLLALAGFAVEAALTLHYQGEILWGVPEEVQQRYQHLRRSIDGFFNAPPRRPYP